MSAALILAFRRIPGVERTIAKSAENGVDHIYLAIDGPENILDQNIQQEIINSAQLMCTALRVDLSILRRTKNLGLAVAVLTALEWFFSQEKTGYIFEDDLIISDEFFKFCESGKEALINNEKVLLISGNQFLESPGSYEATACSYPLIWGWFSTSEKWDIIKKLTIETTKKSKLNLSQEVAGFWNVGAWKARTRLNDSWAIPFAQNFHKLGYLSILPPRNLVSNIGIDEFAAHTLSKQTELGRSVSIHSNDMTDFSKFLDPKRIDEIDSYLEKEVYRIKRRNYASNLKLLIYKLFSNYSESELQRGFVEGCQNPYN